MYTSSYNKGFGLGQVCVVVALLAVLTLVTQL